VTRKKNPDIDTSIQSQLLFENSRDIILLIRKKDGQILEANVAAQNVYRYTRAELLSMTIFDLRSPDTCEDVELQMAQAKSGLLFETRHCRKNGETFPVEVNSQGTIIKGEAALLSIIRDITERKNNEKTLNLHSVIMANLAEGVYLIRSSDGVILYANPRFETMFGYDSGELIGKNVSIVNAPTEKSPEETAKGIMAYLDDHKVWSGEIKNIKKDGTTFWCNASVSQFDHHDYGAVWVSVHNDISERKRMEEEIREVSIRDQLTGLYNRRGFINLVEQQIKSANRAKRPMLLSFIDVDKLKWINDTLGHKEGDNALIDTANMLRETFRDSDIIARLGGDEFAILAIEVTDLNPDAFAKRLQQNIDAYNAKESIKYRLSMSWGNVIYDPASPLSLDELLSQADRLMYMHKKSKAQR